MTKQAAILSNHPAPPPSTRWGAIPGAMNACGMIEVDVDDRPSFSRLGNLTVFAVGPSYRLLSPAHFIGTLGRNSGDKAVAIPISALTLSLFSSPYTIEVGRSIPLPISPEGHRGRGSTRS